MTEKRWEIIDEEFISYTGGAAQLISNGECKVHLWEPPKEAQLFCDKLNDPHEEKEIYKRLFNEMAYYFRDNIKSLNDLDHKDFESLQLLAQGEYFDEESLSWCKVKLEDFE